MQLDEPDSRDEPLMAHIAFTEWLGMKEELNRLTHELNQARNEINMRPHANEWHKLHDRITQLETALEVIRDTIVDPGRAHLACAQFHDIARQALACRFVRLEPCSPQS